MEVLRRVYRGAFLMPALSSALNRVADPRERSLLTDLCYGTLRHAILLDACLQPRLSRPEGLPEEVLDALRLGSYELLIRGTPRHAAVSEWVGLVKEGHPGLAGLVNAVLRRVGIPEDLPWYLRRSLPHWLGDAITRSLGEWADESAAAMLQPEPLWLSAYSSQAQQALVAEGCQVEPGPVGGSLAARCPVPLSRLGPFRDGLVQPQNPSSRLPVEVLAPRPGERVLDLASGNGIKTAQLAAAGAEVTAVEIDRKKIERARRNLARLRLEARHLEADLTETVEVEPAPKVLLDAPCSGTGTLRGNPEIKLRLSPQAVDDLAGLQLRLLRAAATKVAAGGRLVYAVCSLTPQEGREVAQEFLGQSTEFEADPFELPVPSAPSGPGRIVLPLDGLDGFFLARFARAG